MSGFFIYKKEGMIKMTNKDLAELLYPNLKYTIDSDLRVISRNSVNISIREVN